MSRLLIPISKGGLRRLDSEEGVGILIIVGVLSGDGSADMLYFPPVEYWIIFESLVRSIRNASPVLVVPLESCSKASGFLIFLVVEFD
jgi:hypothetical protein